MEKHDHYGHRARLRHRVKHEGLEHFQDYQVLEYALSFVIPYKDTNPLAHKLIKKFGSLPAVLEASEEDLKTIPGMGEASAHFLTSIIKIYSFYEKEKNSKHTILDTPQKTFEYFKNLFAGKLVEEVYVACVTPSRKIITVQKLAEGSATEINLTVRGVTDLVSQAKCHNVIIAHNHPSGSAEPSKEDDSYTKVLSATLAMTDTQLLDHIIIGQDDWYSYRLSHKLDDYLKPYEEKMKKGRLSKKFASFEEVDND